MKVTVLGCGGSTGVPAIGPDWGRCDPTDQRNRRRRVSVLVEIGNLSAERAASTLTELHIEGEAIRGLQRRLQELVNHGRILGTAWGGEIKGT